jgi:hypothetical protein
MPTVLLIAGTQVTTSDLHLLYHRAFQTIGWQSAFLAHDSYLPFGEKILQQSGLRFCSLHFTLFNRRLRSVARRIRPDLVVVSGSNWYVLPETIRWLQRRLGSRVVLNEHHLQVFRPYQAESMRLYDHVFVQDGGLAAVLKAASPARAVSVLGPACDPVEHRQIELTPAERDALGADVGCVGYAYGNRLALFEQLTDYRLRLWGMGWDASPALRACFQPGSVSGLKKTKIYNALKINVNLQSVTYQIDGVTCRPFEVAACGGFCLSQTRKDLNLFFRVGEEMIVFDSPGDLKEKIAYYLEHEEERREIASRARARVLRDHTYEHRVRELLTAIGM